MKATICKEFDFDAAHRLPKMPDGHKCKRLHGHTYRVVVTCRGTVGDDGLVVDYGLISSPIIHALDHQYLNTIGGLENPTTEVLAHWILDRLSHIKVDTMTVRVYESSTTWCEVER